MRIAFTWSLRSAALVLLVAATATAQPGNGTEAAPDLSALRAWVDHYPSEAIGGHAFFDHPQLVPLLRRALGTAGYRRWSRIGSVEVPVEAVAGWIVAHRCQTGDCGDRNVSVLVHPARSQVVVCLFEAGVDASARWYLQGQREPQRDHDGGCPGDAERARVVLSRLGLSME